MFSETPEFYDRFYAWKDYPSEAEQIHTMVTARVRDAKSLLDVACGTGRHLERLSRWYEIAGTDVDPNLLEIARERLGEKVPLTLGDMRELDLGRTFDVVTCLFSSIGYVGDEQGLHDAAAAMARHVAPGGALIVEPWFSREVFDPHHMGFVVEIDETDLKAVRMNGCRVEGRASIFEFHYLIERPGTVEHRVETHTIGLFTDDEYRAAFEATGMTVEHDARGLTGRGLWIGIQPGERPEPEAAAPRASMWDRPPR